MKYCPACSKEFKDSVLFCPHDGQALSNPERSDLVGTVLDEKYRLDKKIGEGGMGKVYQGTHIFMDNQVAIKVLHPELSSDQIALERFRREARAAAQIKHVNAVIVTDFGVSKDHRIAYLVMELLEGMELRRRMTREKQLDPAEIAQNLNQTCDAVHAAHTKEIIHRDLKPDNIWLVKTANDALRIKVLDFGIAKLKSYADAGLTQQGTIVGTPHYMSPEQCRGERDLYPPSDVYSLGVILYEMLTGRVPFDGDNNMAIVYKHSTEEPPSLRAIRPELSAEIEWVVLRALEKNPDRRQQSTLELAQEFARALDAVSADLPTRITERAPLPGKDAGQSGENARAAATKIAHGAAAAASPQLKDTSKRPDSPALSLQDRTSYVVVGSGRTTARDRNRNERLPIVADERQSSMAGSKSYLLAGLAILGLVISIVAAYFYVGGQRSIMSPSAPSGMVLVRGGTFTMGTDAPKDAGEIGQNGPAHGVSVASFYLDINEVTNAEYLRFVKEQNHQPPPNWKGSEPPPGTDKWPVSDVTWDDATAYAEWLGKRLPTEAEWEYAARGKDGRRYPWGPTWSDKFSNSKEDGQKKPVGVSSYPNGRSWCGVYDLAGNVAEWVSDEFQPYDGSKAKPQPGLKVYRGGSFAVGKEECTTFNRWAELPNHQDAQLGFRCAKDATVSK